MERSAHAETVEMRIDLPIIVIGQSHTYALQRGVADNIKEGVLPADSAKFRFLDTNQISGWVSNGVVSKDFINTLDRNSHFVSMLGGNFYNVFGLVEHPMKFDFFCDGSTADSVDTTREIIPYHLMRRHFKTSLTPFLLSPMKQFKEHFAGKAFHICSPPLIATEDHIRRTDQFFKEKLTNGVAPRTIRKKLFDLHSSVIATACREIGVRFLPAPAEAVDGAGILLEKYWGDSTHATRQYGRILHNQILRALAL